MHTSILDVLKQLRQLGVTLETVGGQLKLLAPQPGLPPELLQRVRENRDEILRFMDGNAPVRGGNLIEPLPQRPWYEVSHGQQRLWIAHQLAADKSTYNIPRAYQCTGDLRADALAYAFSALVARHESLRTTFVRVDGELRQLVHACAESGFALVDTDLRNDPCPEEAARAIGRAEAGTPFDLESGPLLRARLVRTADDTHFFFLTMHHLISDDWSMDILVREVLTLYRGFGQAPAHPLPPLAIQYRDYAAWHTAQLRGDLGEKCRRYWLDQFRNPRPCLYLLTDYPPGAESDNRGSSIVTWLDEALTPRLLEACQRYQVSLFTMLLTLVNVLLYRYTHQRDIIVGTTTAGRMCRELEDQIGFFVNTLPLRTRFAAGETFEGLLAAVRDTTVSAFEYQAYPFDRLVEELNLPRDGRRTPLIDVMVQLIDRKSSSKVVGFSDLAVETCPLPGSVSQFDLSFNFYEHRSRIAVNIEYVHHLFRPESILLLGERLLALAEAVLANPAGDLDAFDLTLACEAQDAPSFVADEFAFE